MKLRNRKTGAIAHSNRFNTCGIGEMIVSWSPEDGNDGYDQDSDFIRDYDVWIEALGEWKDLIQAFKDKDVIKDNYNTRFFEPSTEEDRVRGYTL